MEEVVENPFVWKTNLLGGGRLTSLIKRLRGFQTLKDFLDKRKEDNWIYGDGIIEGKKKDSEVTSTDLKKKKYKTAEFLTNKKIFNPIDFDENGIHKTYFCNRKYFQRSRNTKENIFKKPHLLIKKNIGKTSIPSVLLDYDLVFKNEVMGIHCPTKDFSKLKDVHLRIKNNSLYRFYITTTSSRSGVSRSTKTILQKDILNLPFPENKSDIELTKYDKILVDDTLNYGLEFLGKETNVKALNTASTKDLDSFNLVFCELLNKLFETKGKKYYQKYTYKTESFTCIVYKYGRNETLPSMIKANEKIENHIAELVYNKLGTSYRINRVVKIYDGDYIYLLKPKELRYWLQSVALRDADETIMDLYNAGY